MALNKTFMSLADNGKISAKFTQSEQGIAKKISTHLVRLLTIPSVSERASVDIWQPTVEAMSEIVSGETSDVYVKRGKRAILILGQIASLVHEKQDTALIELTEKAADQLVQIVATQCSGSKFSKVVIAATFNVCFFSTLVVLIDYVFV